MRAAVTDADTVGEPGSADLIATEEGGVNKLLWVVEAPNWTRQKLSLPLPSPSSFKAVVMFSRLWFSILVLAVAWSAGCVHAPLNKPLTRYEPTAGFRYRPRPLAADSSDIAILLFFSGGCKRAAALSYGVLKELAATTAPIGGREQRLLDQVEIISSVSGGSFTAAYYCLHHDRIFTDFEPQFLKRNINTALLRSLFSPGHWP